MNTTENCLKHLQNQDWLSINKILSNERNCRELRSDPIFSIFENYLVQEIKKLKGEKSENALLVLVRIFTLNQKNKTLTLSDTCLYEIAQCLFQEYPCIEYASILKNDENAKSFLNSEKERSQKIIDKSILSSKLDISIGKGDKLDFSKSIFNSPQETELYNAAIQIVTDKLIYPNIGLSTIIDSKLLDQLDSNSKSFFFNSSLDLCIINKETFKPELCIELDSSWHDTPKQIHNDQLKDSIFEKAGLELHRLRKRKNQNMYHAFKIYFENHMTQTKK